MKALSNTDAELKKNVAYKKSVYSKIHVIRTLRGGNISANYMSFRKESLVF